MPPLWLQVVAVGFLVLSLLSAVVIVGDLIGGRRQPMGIMNLVWPITALYFGPFGLWAYWSFGRADPSASGHGGHEGDEEGPPSWRTTFKATSHCGAGCVVGDSIGEWAIFLLGITLFGSTLLTAYVFDFVLAYAFGIAFQYFTIAPMRGLGLRDGLIAAVKADTLSLIAFEVGMFGVMALTHLVLFQPPLVPSQPTYWFLMQLAMIVGFATSYPANWLLVKWGVKERM